jgi:predicted lipoprotein with Yx(FWY)xxD motif
MIGAILRRPRLGAGALLAAGLLAAGALLVACGGGSSNSGSNPGGGYGPNPAPSSQAGSSAAGGAAAVMTMTGSLGTYLVDKSGRTLYLYTPDTGTTSTCTGACLASWPALLTSGVPVAGTGATASLLGTTTRGDGTTQVTYHGHPLYYFAGDNSAGQTTGQGVGGIWFVVGPDGNKIGG